MEQVENRRSLSALEQCYALGAAGERCEAHEVSLLVAGFETAHLDSRRASNEFSCKAVGAQLIIPIHGIGFKGGRAAVLTF